MSSHGIACWVCASGRVELQRRGRAVAPLQPDALRITAADYGVTGDVYRCADCGFQFCPTVGRVLELYEQMADADYELTRSQRALQAAAILRAVPPFKLKGELLDVGAGSGILVEEALRLGYAATGIEPSLALSRTAQQRKLPVRTGVLPQRDWNASFDVVTMIDVIEHVESPLALVQEAAAAMKSDAVCVIVTPDIGSIAARLMGDRWWHFRLAHIGYFGRETLSKLLGSAGLEVVGSRRPGWYFPASYLAERLMQYLPAALRLRLPTALGRVTVPLNLFDSLLVIARKRPVASPSDALVAR